MRGIDISNNNDAVNWDGVGFVFIKATESTNFIDRKFAGFRDEAARRGIPWGAYHFAHPDQHTAAAEAAFFLSHATKGPLAPALDFETRTGVNPLSILGPARAAAWINEFNSIVEQAWGQTPYLYTFRSYAATLLPLVRTRWPLWLATANGRPAFPTYLGYPVAIEQYAIVGGVDQNESYVSLTPEVPAPPTQEDEPVFLIATAEDAPYYLTNFIHKWNVVGFDVLNPIIYVAATHGHGIITDPGAKPIILPQAVIDAIPNAVGAVGGAPQITHFKADITPA